MSLTIRVLRGLDATVRLADEGFAEDWRRLADEDPHASVFQGEHYCRSWYEAYADAYEPVLVTASRDGQLTALMSLALRDGDLCHAGDHQCEYQGWLASPDTAESFPPRAVAELFRQLRLSSWEWRNVASDLALDWVEELPRSGPGGVSRETVPCPLLDARDEEFLRARTRGRLRTYRNRLAARGLQYRRVTEPHEVSALLRALATWCDMRQGAVHETMPFAADAAKLPFHRQLLTRPDRFWLSGLFLETTPIAAHVGPFHRGELALGVQGYDAREARLSPGAILIFELAADVAAAGGRWVDLTPGGDRWKERYASTHRDVHRLVFHRHAVATLAGAAARRVEDGARAALRRLGAEPGRIREALEVVTGGIGDEPAVAVETYEVAAGTDLTEFRSPDRQAVDELLHRHAAALEDDAAAEFLGAAGSCLAEGWEPVLMIEDDQLTGLVWRSPLDGWIDLGDAAAPRARGGQPDCTDPALPGDVLLLRANAPCGWLPERGAHVLLGRARRDETRCRVWLLAERGLPERLDIACTGPATRAARAS